ncbi:hypothetical protein FEM48_Zijuj05G0139500 [Ziziphus jujuba var. spinosa]|uniref:Malectin-like domain-containing protein n=1 Tax=Ziziphus jujuba var. spinosa TaxID=714518 RepID=A0A978VF83_ZIZJJ|nr:hypothetical protein FEM48_Zijuj05G0139500 [Ziziphus jujuba var. spinosa]
MGGEKNGVLIKPQPISSLSFIFLLIFSSFNFHLTKAKTNSSSSSSSSVVFSPPDNYLIDCGSSQQTKLSDGRTFKSERDTSSLLSTEEDIEASADSITATASSSIPSSSLPLYQTARIFTQESTYTFHISQTGKHWLRLYFYPLPHPTYNLTNAVFKVSTDSFVLLENFSVKDGKSYVYKEYLVQANSDRFSLIFKPAKNSFAFINGIEVVSAPDSLNIVADGSAVIPSVGYQNGFSSSDHDHAFQVNYRLNVGGPTISPKDDTLSRTWESDSPYNSFPQGTKNVSVSPTTIKYPEQNGSNPLVAPSLVYSSVQEMEDSETMESNFNLTWKMNVENGFDYLIRLHFCDIISKAMNNLYFNVYINSFMAISNLDLSALTGSLSTAYYRDFVVLESSIVNQTIMVQVGDSNIHSGIGQAILNGLEVMKMSNKDSSLDGISEGSESSSGMSRMKIVAAIGLSLAVTAMLLLGIVCVRWKRKPHGDPALPREQVSLAEWAMKWHRNGNIEKIVDPLIATSISSASLKKFVEAAEKCLAEHGVDRPSMGDVLWNLEYALQLQEASSQIDPPEDKTANIIDVQKLKEVDHDVDDDYDEDEIVKENQKANL